MLSRRVIISLFATLNAIIPTISQAVGEEVNILTLITPFPGEKKQRTLELLAELTSQVEENEPITLFYHTFEQYNGTDGTPGEMIILQERYVNEAAFLTHSNTSYYKSILGMVANESLLSVPNDIVLMKPAFGFSR